MILNSDIKSVKEEQEKINKPLWFQFKERKIYKDTWSLDVSFINWLEPRITKFIECETKTHNVDDSFLKDLNDIKEACEDFLLQENDPWAWKEKHHIPFTELEEALKKEDRVKIEIILNHAKYNKAEKKLLKKILTAEDRVCVRRKYKLHKFIKVLDKLWW